MKRKNGFTLIELLAVIVILAIIALITSPIVIGVIDKSRKEAFRDSAYGVIEAGRIYYLESVADTNAFTGKTFDLSNGELKLSGEKPKGGTLEIKDDGKMILMMHNGNYCATKSEDKETVEISKLADGKCEIQENNSGAQTIRDMGVVTSGDGLYVNEPNLGGGHVFKGTNPNNLLLFDNKCWSVISVEDNDEIKIIYEGEAADSTICTRNGDGGSPGTWQWNASNNWHDEDLSVRSKLEGIASGQRWNDFKKMTRLDKVSDHAWNVGAVTVDIYSGGSIQELLEQEKNGKDPSWSTEISSKWNNKLGLINVSDVVKSSTSSRCTSGVWGTMIGAYLPDICGNESYLVKNYAYWTLNAVTNGNVAASSGNASNSGYLSNNFLGVRPVLYLDRTVEIKGNGTSDHPFVVS